MYNLACFYVTQDMPQIISTTIAEGSLRKESHDILKQWQERYFVLNATTRRLTYYADKSKKVMKGEYELTEKSSVLEGLYLYHTHLSSLLIIPS